VRTLVLSDLHLGARRPIDILRRPEPLDALCSGLARVDRLVLLGDVLELRQGPAREALAAAGPTLEAIGGALPRGAEVLILAGNHDHEIVAPWLAARGASQAPEPLGLGQTADASASPLGEALAARLGSRVDVRLAYPGFHLRDDIWATHGHYLDRLITVPTFERIAAGGMARIVGRLPEAPGAHASAEEFEAALAPMYAWLNQIASGRAAGGRWAASGATVKAFELLNSDGRRPLRGLALAALLPLGIAGLNLAGLGPVRHRIDGAELRRAGLVAMGRVVELLGVQARHVIFGHTHCAGPLDWHDPAEFRTPSGIALMNSGCWVEEPRIETQDVRSPYRPGFAVLVEDDGPPRLVRVTEDLGRAAG
jgi:predicted phosphodiesterase